MRFNSMNKENEKKKDYSKYIMLAIVFAFVVAFFLDILVKIFLMFGKVLFKYWWGGVVLILVILFMRRRGKKKK